jgi:peptidoglycan hydrolase-like protein with peptidoglycan-binding domain
MSRRTSIAILALAALPVLASAQQDTARTPQDTSRAGQRGDTARGRAAAGDVELRGRATGRGGNAYGRGTLGLTNDQVMELQQALRDAGCDPGSIDGLLGPRTRRAMACARQQNNLTGNNANELFRSLNLSFTASDSMGMGGVMRGARGRGQNPTRDNQGRIRPPADSAGADSTNARPPTAAQQGQGMHDSTTARSNPPNQRPPR